jgi:hypothetical protein
VILIALSRGILIEGNNDHKCRNITVTIFSEFNEAGKSKILPLNRRCVLVGGKQDWIKYDTGELGKFFD